MDSGTVCILLFLRSDDMQVLRLTRHIHVRSELSPRKVLKPCHRLIRVSWKRSLTSSLSFENMKQTVYMVFLCSRTIRSNSFSFSFIVWFVWLFCLLDANANKKLHILDIFFAKIRKMWIKISNFANEFI